MSKRNYRCVICTVTSITCWISISLASLLLFITSFSACVYVASLLHAIFSIHLTHLLHSSFNINSTLLSVLLPQHHWNILLPCFIFLSIFFQLLTDLLLFLRTLVMVALAATRAAIRSQMIICHSWIYTTSEELEEIHHINHLLIRKIIKSNQKLFNLTSNIVMHHRKRLVCP